MFDQLVLIFLKTRELYWLNPVIVRNFISHARLQMFHTQNFI